MAKLSKGVQLVSTRQNHKNYSRGLFLKLIFLANTCNKLFLPLSELQAATKWPSHTTGVKHFKAYHSYEVFWLCYSIELKIKKKKPTREILVWFKAIITWFQHLFLSWVKAILINSKQYTQTFNICQLNLTQCPGSIPGKVLPSTLLCFHRCTTI